jgi:HNH endonuclease
MDASLVRRVWQRAKHRCEYCQLSQDEDDRTFEIDHVISEKHHGLTGSTNLALSCFRNDPFRVKVREALIEEGVFPPG